MVKAILHASGERQFLHAGACPDPANPATGPPATAIDGRVPGEQAPRSPEPARFRLLHHAHLVLTEGTSLRLAEATAGKGVIPLAT